MVINTLTPGVSVPTTPPPAVPKPETWGMLLLGLSGIGLLAQRKRVQMASSSYVCPAPAPTGTQQAN